MRLSPRTHCASSEQLMPTSSISLSSLAPSSMTAKEQPEDPVMPKKMTMNISLPNMPPDPQELLGLDRTTSTPLAPMNMPSVQVHSTESEVALPAVFAEENGKAVLKGGTFQRIVAWIVFDRDLDKEMFIRFILTYKIYYPAPVLFKILTETFLKKGPAAREVMMPKVIAFLKEWAQRSFSADFKRGLFKQLLDFVVVHLPEEANFFKLMVIKDMNALLKKPAAAPESPTPIGDWLEYPAEVIAAQLTLVEWNMFQKIVPVEFYSGSWLKRNKVSATNLTNMAKFFNQVSYWVSTEIVRAWHISPKRQLSVVKRFLKIAEELQKLNNFDCLMAILSGLSNASISRLKHMWELLPENYADARKRLEEFMRPQANFKNYRDFLATKPKEVPCIPYLAIYLRDIIFINDGNPDYLEEGVINLEKMILLGSRIQEVLSIVSIPYSTLQPDVSLKHFLINLKPWDEEELYSQSLVCEPLRGASVLTAIPEEEEEEAATETSSVSNDDLASVSSLGTSVSGTGGGSGIIHRTTIANPNDITTWGVLEVLLWLESIGGLEYKRQFEKNGIDGSRLLQLDDAALQALNVTKFGHRKRILKSIQDLTTSTPSFTVPTRISSEPEASFWTPAEVSNWVKSFEDEGRNEIISALQGMNGQQLLAVTNEVLVSRGLEKLGLRKKVLRSVQSLKEGNNPHDSIYYKDPSTWTIGDISLWLDINELSEYKRLFLVQKITGAELMRMTNDTLLNLGVSKLGHRKALLKCIQALKEQNEFKKACSSSSMGSSTGSLNGPITLSPHVHQRRRSNPTPMMQFTPKPFSSCSSEEGYSSAKDEDFFSSDDEHAPSDAQPITIQAIYGDTQKIFNASSSLSLYLLKKKMTQEGLPKRTIVKFTDADGDLVTIGDNDSLKIAIDYVLKRDSKLVLYVSDEKRKRSASSER
eukprot:TRINITY_DN7603_c0_g1_i1.p1 TRINITY_DN7603_c0_g1~~TRINITY_DN7603_c0_g1_i1.p1  ORF type:complete len:929 (-),score=165.64 TRINITY_DN7603_c0_g1_i1:115-2901(-)